MWNGGKLCAKLRAQLSAVAGASCLWQLSAWDEFESQEGVKRVRATFLQEWCYLAHHLPEDTTLHFFPDAACQLLCEHG